MKRLTQFSFIFFSFLIVTFSLHAQFSLPDLPYSYSALEPYIDSTTMKIHHGTHHKAYVNNLNNALKDYPEIQGKTLQELMNIKSLPIKIQTAVRNNGGGHYNHSFFWEIMRTAKEDNMPSKQFMSVIDKSFGSYENFKAAFEKEGLTRFGSGWVWVVAKEDGALTICSTPNQDNTLMDIAEVKGRPVLALDVWEHAYYLKYQSKRAGYIGAFWNVVNWDKVFINYLDAIKDKVNKR